jgi:hypothetical protein
LHLDFCCISDAHILRRKRFLFDFSQFLIVAECIANSEPNARRSSFAFPYSNAHKQRYGYQSG